MIEGDPNVADWQVWEDWCPEPKPPANLAPAGPWYPFAAVTITRGEENSLCSCAIYRRPLRKAAPPVSPADDMAERFKSAEEHAARLDAMGAEARTKGLETRALAVHRARGGYPRVPGDAAEEGGDVMEAKNVKAIREWLTKNRPDVTPMFDRIMCGESEGNAQMIAIFAFMAMAFSAGREYQRANPKDVEP